MGKLTFKLLFFAIVLIAAAGTLLFFVKKNSYNKVLADVQLPSNPTPIPETLTTSVESPDGNQTLNMNLQGSNGLRNYTFTSDKLNFTKIVPNSSTMSIPYNTWSPDDKRVFIKEDTGSQVNFYEEPADINVTDKFIETFPNYHLQDVTGWASPTLLIINANNGSSNVSYWFDLTSQTFIPLATRFN